MLDRFIDWLDKILSDKNRVRQLVSASLLLFVCAAAILTLAVFAGSEFRRNVPDGSDPAVSADPTRQTPTEAPTDPTGPIGPEPPESSAPGSDSTPGTAAPVLPEGETVPLSEKSVSELQAEGYVISWGVYDPEDHVFARLCTDDERLAKKLYTLGSTKTVRVIDVTTYEDGGMEFPGIREESAERAAVELYMGYILVDIGPDEGGVSSLAVFSSDGKEIGVFSADMLVPALTRDSADHPLFISNGHYLYIDEKTSTLKESDYIDEVDGRGLYFDYNPDYGKSDSSLHIYSTRQTVKMTYEMDMSSYYTRYGVDYRIAREFQEKYPAYAEAVARNISSNEYYNLLFHVFYEAAKEQIAAEKESGTYEPLPQVFPWETTEASTTGKTPSVTTGKTPSVTTGKTPAVTTGKGTGKATEKNPGKATSAPEPAEITVPEETHTPGTGSASGTAEPEDITVPEPSTAVPTEKATTKAVTTKAVTTKAVTTKAVTTAPASTAKPKLAAKTAAVTEALTEEPTGTAQTPDATKTATGTSVPTGTETPTGEETTAPAAPNKVISVSRIYDAYRFIYKSSDPGADESVTTTVELAYTPYITQTLTWKSQYKHAKAYNFSEGRAVTVTDNGIVRVINTGGGSAIYLYRIFKADASMGSGYMTEFFIEPARRDVTMLGYYYFDEGLMRLRKCNRLSHVINKYNEDRDILVDINGREYTIPEGYTLVSYSEGVLLLERQGRYGYFHKDGYWIAQPVYTSAMPFVEGVAVLGRADGTFGAIDKEGKIVIPFDYTSLSNASSGIFAGFSPARGWEILAKMTPGAEETETKAVK